MSEERLHGIGTETTMAKTVSEADIALFELVTRDIVIAADEPPAPTRKPRQIVPPALLAAVMASAAARLAPMPEAVRLEHQTVHFRAPAYTDDTVSAVAELTAYDEIQRRILIHAWCDNQDGLRLAEGEFVLSDG